MTETQTKTKIKEATEVKGDSKDPSPEELMQAAAKRREKTRQACGEEIDKVLKKHNCELTAQMIVGETRIVPQVFIIDARNS